MDAKFNISYNILSFSDSTVTSNPTKTFVDWSSNRSYLVQNPKSNSYDIPTGEFLVLFDGNRTTSVDNSTEFELTLSPLDASRYRFTYTGTGAAPGFDTDHGLALNTKTVTLTVNNNLTVTFTSEAGDFDFVSEGDTLFIPGVETGDDAGPFNSINVGYWRVLSVAGDGSSIEMSRLTGTDFSGITEEVTITDNIQVQAFTLNNVQVGDTVTISSGFSSSVLKTYSVVAINPFWFEVISSIPLPINVTGVPTTAGIQFYTNAKRYFMCLVDQECVIQLNGDTSDLNRISPWEPASPDDMGMFVKTGPISSAIVVNKSTETLNIYVVTTE